MKKVIENKMLCDNLTAEKQEQISKIANSIINTEVFKSNVISFTTDTDTFYNSLILLNTAIYLSHVDKRILIFDLDFKNKYILSAIKKENTDEKAPFTSRYKNIEYISYDNKEVFVKEISEKDSLEALEKTFNEYDLVLVNLPSLIDDSAYLSLPQVFDTYIITIKRYKSRIPRINKIIDKIKADGKTVVGSVFDESIK